MTYLIIGLLLLVFGLASFFVVGAIKKEDRKFEKKQVVIYLLITLLIFFFLGLAGLIPDRFDGSVYMGGQVAVLLFGVYHAWALFNNYDWADHASFWPESLLTMSLTFLAGLGMLIGLVFWTLVFNDFDFQYISPRFLSLYSCVFCFPIPYLLLRTYDFIKQIPPRTYLAWHYPDMATPTIDLSRENVLYVYMDLYTTAAAHPSERIKEQRSRIPYRETFGDFFQNFVDDHNGQHPQRSITHLRHDEAGQALGWVFYAKSRKGGRRRLIDPFEGAAEQVQEGDLIIAKRVPMGQKQEKNPANDIVFESGVGNRRPPQEDDDEIIITER